MKHRLHACPVSMIVPLLMVACLATAGCKQRAAFLIVNAQTNEPIPHAVIDHHTNYDYDDPRGGDQYLKSTTPADENGWYEIKKPQTIDLYRVRVPGYAHREIRMTKIGKLVEYQVVGGPTITQWVEAEEYEDDDEDKVNTFIIPIEPR